MVTATQIQPGVTRRVRAIRELRALGHDYRYHPWKEAGDEFEASYDSDLSHAWVAPGPDGQGVSLWVGQDIELTDETPSITDLHRRLDEYAVDHN